VSSVISSDVRLSSACLDTRLQIKTNQERPDRQTSTRICRHQDPIGLKATIVCQPALTATPPPRDDLLGALLYADIT